MYENSDIKLVIGEMNSSKYLCSNNSVARLSRTESVCTCSFRSWETFINITPAPEIIPGIHMQSLIPGNENCVSRKHTKFNQVGRPTDTVVGTGLNGAQWRHCCKVVVSFIINCLHESLMYCFNPQVFYMLFVSNYAARLKRETTFTKRG